MAVTTRCPECRAKLRIDDLEDGVPVECPRCGNLFRPALEPAGAAAPSKAARQKGDDAVPGFAPDGGADAPPRRPKSPRPAPAAEAPRPPRPPRTNAKPPAAEPKARLAAGDGRKVRSRKKTTNPAVLLGAVLFGFAMLIGLFFLMQWVLGRAGKTSELLTHVPEKMNSVRGVNVAQLAKYPGYKAEVAKFVTPAVQSAADAVADAGGQDKANFLEYLVIAKHRPVKGPMSVMYVMRTKTGVSGAVAGPALPNAKAATVGGESAFQCSANAPGILSGGTVFFPAERVVVVVTGVGDAAGTAEASAAGRKGANWGKLLDTEDTLRVAMRASIWFCARGTDGMGDFIEKGVKPLASGALKPLYDAGAKSKMFGMWSSPGGGGVRIGCGLECESGDDATKLVKSFRDGPLGKGDESEPTNEMRGAGVQFLGQKRVFGEFMQFIKYRSDRKCAYLNSKCEHPDAVKLMFNAFSNPSLGDAPADNGGGRPGAGGPGG